MVKKISIIGSGNVATQLAFAFIKASISIKQIISKNLKSGQLLAKKTNSLFNNDIKNLLKTDLIIICINDDSITNVINSLPDIPIVHTSGTTDISSFKKKKNIGVLYPIQSLNQELIADFHKIPICIEANTKSFQKKITSLAKKISQKVVYLNSTQRIHLHVSAVIASNFSNFCYIMAKKNLDNYNLDFSLLKPLIQETTRKTIHRDPLLNQTGPAKRGDKKIIKKHLTILKDENYKKIYKLLSETILKEYEK